MTIRIRCPPLTSRNLPPENQRRGFLQILQRDDGQAMVEFAIILFPLLFIAFIGFWFMFYWVRPYIGVQSASYALAQFAADRPANGPTVSMLTNEIYTSMADGTIAVPPVATWTITGPTTTTLPNGDTGTVVQWSMGSAGLATVTWDQTASTVTAMINYAEPDQMAGLPTLVGGQPFGKTLQFPHATEMKWYGG